MSARRAVVLTAAWVAVVLVGSSLVWVVISRVGSEMSQPVAASPDPDPPGTTGQGTPGPRGSGTPSTGGPTPDGPTSAITSDTWSGTPGTMRVSCRGSTVTDWSASPDVGWYLETEREHQGVRADFEQGSEGREIRVEAVCTPDGPTFATSDEAS